MFLFYRSQTTLCWFLLLVLSRDDLKNSIFLPLLIILILCESIFITSSVEILQITALGPRRHRHLTLVEEVMLVLAFVQILRYVVPNGDIGKCKVKYL